MTMLNKSGVTSMKPGKFYVEFNHDNGITYIYVNPLGEKKNETIWGIRAKDFDS